MSNTSALVIFIRQALQLVPLSSLSWPRSDLLIESTAQYELAETLFKPANLRFLLPSRYEILLLKELTLRLEGAISDPEEQEINDDLMLRLSQLLSEPMPSEIAASSEESYVSYSVPLPSPNPEREAQVITLKESRSVISGAGTTGLRTWEAALHLCTWLCGTNKVFEKNILELGTGTGIVSILCAKYLGAGHVLATDGSLGVLESLENNLSINGLASSHRIAVKQLSWNENTADVMSSKLLQSLPSSRMWDMVLAADVTYDPDVVRLLGQTIKDLLAAFRHLEVIVSATMRSKETFDGFKKAFAQEKFSLQEIEFEAPWQAQTELFHATNVPIKIISIKKCQKPGSVANR